MREFENIPEAVELVVRLYTIGQEAVNGAKLTDLGGGNIISRPAN